MILIKYVCLLLFILIDMTISVKLFSIIFIVASLFPFSEAKTTAKTLKIQSGKLYMQVKQTPSSSPQLFQLSYDSSVKSQLKLTQSSKIDIQAKMKFGSETFDPQLFSFRLVHPKYDKLTQPIQSTYDSQSESWKCTIDLGDPRTIQPYSDLYKLELSIADPRLATPFRSQFATLRLSFRHSLPQSKLPTSSTPISYTPLPSILTQAPQSRIDPPPTFTLFLLFVMTVFTVIFFYGLFVYLGANLKLLPRDGLGLLLNVGLIGLLAANLGILGKFWLEWGFIQTVGWGIWVGLATAAVANYALLYMKNRR